MTATKMTRYATVLACALFLTSAARAVTCSGTPLVCTGTSGSLAASATFSFSGSTLTVVFTNTSSSDVLVPPDVLTALFFNISGNPTLTPSSALLSGGSTVFFGADGGGNVGGEFAYLNGLSPYLGTSNMQGISSAGFGLFGSANFGGADLNGNAAVDGLGYGLTSAGDDTTTGNAAVTGGNALIKNQVTFTLTGLPGGFALANISNVTFQYGTALSPTDPCIGCTPQEVVPETSSATLLGSGLLLLAAGSLFKRFYRS